MRKREKLFGDGRPRPMDREAKIRIMHLARCLSRRTEPGKAYGQLTAKYVQVLEALLWGFHNAKSGLCYPSLDRIAEVAHCARSTVHEAIKSLEAAGLMTWCNRLRRVRLWSEEMQAVQIKVLRTSNGYQFRDPQTSKSDLRTGTGIQDFPSYLQQPRSGTKGALRGGKSQDRGQSSGTAIML